MEKEQDLEWILKNSIKQYTEKDLEDAFEAGRKEIWNDNQTQSRIWEPDWISLYKTFEDWLKSR